MQFATVEVAGPVGVGVTVASGGRGLPDGAALAGAGGVGVTAGGVIVAVGPSPPTVIVTESVPTPPLTVGDL